MCVNPSFSLLHCERWTSCERPTAMADVTLLQSQLMVCKSVHVALLVVRAGACACKLLQDPFLTGAFPLTTVVQTVSVLQYLSRSHVMPRHGVGKRIDSHRALVTRAPWRLGANIEAPPPGLVE